MKSWVIKVFLVVSVFLVSCNKKIEESDLPQQIRINIVDEIQSLDPRKAKDLNSIAFMRMIYEGLTRFSRKGDIELALAKSVEVSKDRKTYTFKLRDSFWNDGTKVTSYDFAKSWKKALSPSFVSIMCYKLFIIEGAKEVKEGLKTSDFLGISTPDSSTLVVKLIHPIPYFLDLLAAPVFFPVSEKLDSESGKWEDKEQLYLGNGPFYVKKWSHQNYIELAKNRQYFEASDVRLNRIFLYMVAAETELKMFETGKIDWAGSPFSSLPIDAIKYLSHLNTFVKRPFLGTSFIRINMNWCEKNFGSEEDRLFFRKGLAYSIDRDTIVNHVLYESQEAAHGFLPPPFSKDNFFPSKGNEDFILKFKKLGVQGHIKIIFVNNDTNNLVMQTIQRQWEEKLGLKVELEPLELKVYLHRLFSGKYQLALSSWMADFFDSINFLELFKYKNNGINNTFWENAEYIDLLNMADVSINIEERNKFLRKAHTILMEDMPIIPLFYLNMCYLKNEKIKEVVVTPIGSVDFRWAYLEE